MPIRSLGRHHRRHITVRLLAPEPHDRYLRFGPAARDEQITRYVERLDFDRDEVFAIFSRGSELIAMAYLAHAAVAPQPQAGMASQKWNHAIKRQASRQVARASSGVITRVRRVIPPVDRAAEE